MGFIDRRFKYGAGAERDNPPTLDRYGLPCTEIPSFTCGLGAYPIGAKLRDGNRLSAVSRGLDRVRTDSNRAPASLSEMPARVAISSAMSRLVIVYRSTKAHGKNPT